MMQKEEFKACAESLRNTNAHTCCKKDEKAMIGRKTMLCYEASDTKENDINATNNDAGLNLFTRACKIDD